MRRIGDGFGATAALSPRLRSATGRYAESRLPCLVAGEPHGSIRRQTTGRQIVRVQIDVDVIVVRVVEIQLGSGERRR